MNSWQIIRSELIGNSQPNTFGRNVKIDLASQLFIKLKNNLIDKEDSIKSFNEDDEVLDAICARKCINELRGAGVIN